MAYRHTQIGFEMIFILGSAILLIVGRNLLYGLAFRSFVVPIILSACLLIFPSLTIKIQNGFLTWRFGFGLIRKKVLLSDIISITPTRTTILQGWGIHRTSGGWLYNVSGFQAVQVVIKDGKKFKLGTDEPDELVRMVSLHLRSN